jgi:ABC-type thiamine transport system substrate-binding protein
MKVKGAPVDYVSWGDVTRPIVPEQFGVAANSKNLKLAYAFLNWMLGHQVQSAWDSQQYWLPTNKTVPLPPVLTAAGFANSAATAGQLNTLNDAWLSWFNQRSVLTNQLTSALT